MIVKTEIALKNFEFWSGAADRAKYLTNDEFNVIESHMDDIFPDGADETDINDFMWFEDDFIAELLGYNNFEEIMNRDVD